MQPNSAPLCTTGGSAPEYRYFFFPLLLLLKTHTSSCRFLSAGPPSLLPTWASGDQWCGCSIETGLLSLPQHPTLHPTTTRTSFQNSERLSGDNNHEDFLAPTHAYMLNCYVVFFFWTQFLQNLQRRYQRRIPPCCGKSNHLVRFGRWNYGISPFIYCT